MPSSGRGARTARKDAARKTSSRPRAPKAPPAGTSKGRPRQPIPPAGDGGEAASLAESARQLQDLVSSLSGEVRGLRQVLSERVHGAGDRLGSDLKGAAPPEGGALREVTFRLTQTADSLAESLAAAPKAVDFEPLAEQLYELARAVPQLRESLEAIPRATAPIDSSVRALQEIADTLQFLHQSFSDSLMKVPRAEDYEPLAGPLREFAKVSPALAESLGEVLRVTAPLADSARGLRRIGESLEATRESLTQAVEALRAAQAAPYSAPGSLQERLREAASEMGGARDSILEALATLPREPEYQRFAAHLRELATVSPSLMDWLKQVPSLTAPLEGSVLRLHEAAARLHAGQERLAAAIEELELAVGAGPPGRTAPRTRRS